MCNLWVLSLIRPVSRGGRIGPLILGETILGLDELSENPSGFMQGCPLLVHIWLHEKLRLITPPPPKCQFSSFRRRPIEPFFKELSDRGQIHMVFPPREIAWVQTFLGIRSVILHCSTLDCVALPGLIYSTFYFPWRCLRQVGLRQDIPVGLPTKPWFSFHAGWSEVQNIASYWVGKKVVPIPEYQMPGISWFYENWLATHLANRSSGADRKEGKGPTWERFTDGSMGWSHGSLVKSGDTTTLRERARFDFGYVPNSTKEVTYDDGWIDYYLQDGSSGSSRVGGLARRSRPQAENSSPVKRAKGGH